MVKLFGYIHDHHAKIRNTQISTKTTVCLLFFLILITFGLQASLLPALNYSASPTANVTTQTPVGTPQGILTPTTALPNTPTTTLMPLPAIKLNFPALTSTSTITPTPNEYIIMQTPKASDIDKDADLNPRTRLLIFVVVILWLLLAGYLVIFIHQFR